MPAIHRNRMEIKALFERTITDEKLGYEASAIAEAARKHLRAKFLSVPVAVSGANFGVAETGTVVVVESEGNGRMCTTLPRVLVTVMGIEKVLPEWRDLEVFLQLLPRSSTAERMNPYTSLWTGVRAGDGPQEFHLVLLDNGRTNVLADEVGRQALHCIRCSACLNVCPVYTRVGGQAYESVYPGPIGAVLSPQLFGLDEHPTLPWASTLCGACYDACPVKIEIPSLLVHLRGRVDPRAEVAAERRGAGDEGGRRRVRVAGPLRARAEARAARPRADRQGRAPGLDGDARPARPTESRPSGSGGVSAAREEVLSRVRSALGPGVAVPEIPREYPAGRGCDDSSVDRFCERVAEYRATVTRVAAADLADTVARLCRERGASRIAVPRGGPDRIAGVEVVVDDPPLSPQALDQLDGVLTGCALAIAETGTIVLDGGERSGRRALTLVPDWHLCIVEAERGGRGRARRGRGAGGGRPRGAAHHARLWPERDLRHRARPRRGRPRAADARRAGPHFFFGNFSLTSVDATVSSPEALAATAVAFTVRRCFFAYRLAYLGIRTSIVFDSPAARS